MMGVEFGSAQNRVGRELLPALAEQVLPGIAHVPCSPSGGDFPFQVDRGVSHYFGVGAYRRPLNDARTCAGDGSSPRAWPSPLFRAGRPSTTGAWIPARPVLGGLEETCPARSRHRLGLRRHPRPLRRGDLRCPAVDVRYSDAERYLDLGRAAVAEAVESTVREFRRPSSACAGLLVISQRDALPGPGWGLVDAFGRPKSSYYAFRRASRPRAVSLYDDGLSGVRAVVFNDLRRAAAGRTHRAALRRQRGGPRSGDDGTEGPCRRRCRGLGRRPVSVTFSTSPTPIASGPLQIDVIEATFEADPGQRVDRTHLLPTGHRRDRRVDLGLRAWFEPAGDAVTVCADQFAHFVSIDVSDAELDDDWFHLSPGEERTVGLRSKTASARRIRARPQRLWHRTDPGQPR